MVRLQTLDLRIGVRVPASQPIPSFFIKSKNLKVAHRSWCLCPLFAEKWTKVILRSAVPLKKVRSHLQEDQ